MFFQSKNAKNFILFTIGFIETLFGILVFLSINSKKILFCTRFSNFLPESKHKLFIEHFFVFSFSFKFSSFLHFFRSFFLSVWFYFIFLFLLFIRKSMKSNMKQNTIYFFRWIFLSLYQFSFCADVSFRLYELCAHVL